MAMKYLMWCYKGSPYNCVYQCSESTIASLLDGINIDWARLIAVTQNYDSSRETLPIMLNSWDLRIVKTTEANRRTNLEAGRHRACSDKVGSRAPRFTDEAALQPFSGLGKRITGFACQRRELQRHRTLRMLDVFSKRRAS